MLADLSPITDSRWRLLRWRDAAIVRPVMMGGRKKAMRAFVAEKWPEMLVAVGFALTWTAIVLPRF